MLCLFSLWILFITWTQNHFLLAIIFHHIPFNIYYSLCNRLKYFMMMFNQTHCFRFAHMSIANKFIYIYLSWVDMSALCNWVNLKESLKHMFSTSLL
jgi:hypothetical protein